MKKTESQQVILIRRVAHQPLVTAAICNRHGGNHQAMRFAGCANRWRAWAQSRLVRYCQSLSKRAIGVAMQLRQYPSPDPFSARSPGINRDVQRNDTYAPQIRYQITPRITLSLAAVFHRLNLSRPKTGVGHEVQHKGLYYRQHYRPPADAKTGNPPPFVNLGNASSGALSRTYPLRSVIQSHSIKKMPVSNHFARQKIRKTICHSLLNNVGLGRAKGEATLARGTKGNRGTRFDASEFTRARQLLADTVDAKQRRSLARRIQRQTRREEVPAQATARRNYLKTYIKKTPGVENATLVRDATADYEAKHNGRPSSPARAQGPWQQQVPQITVDAVADRVMQQIDHRVTSWRERTGRM